MKALLFSFLFLLSVSGYSQVIVNGDLEGPTNVPGSTLAAGWQAIPVGDPNSIASNPGIGDTPDLTSLTGPLVANGILGNPYSGNTFMSGFISSDGFGNRHHEGIMQTISGFMPDSSYEIGIMQAVVKQSNCLDESGSWAFYLDNTLIGISTVVFSSEPFNSTSFSWHLQTFEFTATATTHTIKFLPTDDDTNISLGNISGSLRMGIDSIHFRRLPCNLMVDLGRDTTMCEGRDVLLNAANPGASYTWSTGSVSPAIVATQAGTYWVNVSNGTCSATDTITIATLPLPTVILGNDTALCEGQPLQIEAIATPGASFLWHTGHTTPVISATFSGNYQVWATVNGCTSTDGMMVQFHPYPDFTLGPDTVLCTGTKLLLSAEVENGLYNWQNGSASANFEVSQSGIYSVEVSVNGCSSSDTLAVTFLPRPTVSLGNDTAICEGNVVQLFATSSAPDLRWFNNTAGTTTEVNQTGNYWVTAHSNGCLNSDTISVVVKPLPVVNLGNDTTVCEGDAVILDTRIPGAGYRWQDGSSASSYVAKHPGNYWVEVTRDGCSSKSQEVMLSFTDCTSQLIMPNIFSPNNDGVNDFFEPERINAITSMRTVIFNRWGNKVFESELLNNYWDGTTSGNLVPEGTYFYQITYEGVRSNATAIKGWVTIVR